MLSYTITYKNQATPIEKSCKDLGISNIGIVTRVPDTGSPCLVGKLVVGGTNGSVFFPSTGTWASDATNYFYRDLNKGEQVIIEGK